MNDNQNIDIVSIPAFLEGATEEIINVYKDWYKKHKKLEERPDRYYRYEVPGSKEVIEIDLQHAPLVVKKKLKRLPKKEQTKLQPLISEFSREKARLGLLKKKWANSNKSDKLASVASLDPFAATIIELCGQWKTNREVQQIIEEQYGFKVSEHRLLEFKKKNLDKINKLKSQWEGSYDEFSVTKKRGRIENLVYLLNTQRDEYKRSNTFPTLRSKEIREIIKQIKDEIEGNKLSIDVNGNINITASINMNMNIRDLTKRVSLNNFIVALVAGMRGVDQTKMMNRLTNSYYRAFNGFTQSTGNETVVHPSDLINHYDWNAIQRKHEQKQDIQDAQIIEEQSEPKSVDLKEKLMELMTGKFKELDKSIETTKK